MVVNKRSSQRLAHSIGVPVPLSLNIFAQNITHMVNKLQWFMGGGSAGPHLQWPIFAKTNSDGSGNGVFRWDSMDSVWKWGFTRNCCRLDLTCPWGKKCFMGVVESFEPGVTTTCIGSAVDGELLGSFCYGMLLTSQPVWEQCFGYESRARVGRYGRNVATGLAAADAALTFEDPSAQESIEKMVRKVGFTGIFAADFRTSGVQPPKLIDFNWRMSAFAGADPGLTGMSPGPVRKLYLQLAGKPVHHHSRQLVSTVIAHFRPMDWNARGCLHAWLSCNDINVDVPWEHLKHFRSKHHHDQAIIGWGAMRYEPKTCSLWQAGNPHHKVRGTCAVSDGDHACPSACKQVVPAAQRRLLSPLEIVSLNRSAWLNLHACREDKI